MSKFNETKVGANLTTNKSGHIAYKMEDRLKLVTMVLTSFFGEQKYYGNNTNELVQLAKKLIENKDGRFVANLAVFARKEIHLRSVAQALSAILAGEPKGKEFAKYAISGVIERADDITEILSCYLALYKKPIANSLKKGLAIGMNKFDEYQFGKYLNGNKKDITFKDVLKITHAKAKDDVQNKIFKSILEDNLKTPYTWEVELSANGNNAQTWEKLIDSGKVGVMALVRNLNNIIKAQPQNIDKVYSKLRDKETILKSKLLPFRFYSAHRVLEQNALSSSKVFDTLEIAIRNSIDNMEKLKGKTLIAIDVSGSMQNNISAKSDVSCADISCLIGSMANYLCEDSIVSSFDTNLYIHKCSTLNGILANAKSINKNGGGTSLKLPLEYIIKNKIKVDRIIMLSDNEINSDFSNSYNKTCQSLINQYQKEINSNVYVHAIDLQGYGTQQFFGKNTNVISGWSEKVFDFIHLFENGIDKLVGIIEKYEEISENVDINEKSED